MSARITTHTLFTDIECLEKALNSVGVKYHINGDRIITDHVSYYEPDQFIRQGEKFVFIHEPYMWNRNGLLKWNDVGHFLTEVDEAYQKHYSDKLAKLAEEERIREEERKRKLIEEKKQEIIQKAKSKGYYITEKKNGNQVQLVLVKTVY